MNQQGEQCMDLEGGVVNLASKNSRQNLGDVEAKKIMEDSINLGDSALMIDIVGKAQQVSVGAQSVTASLIEVNPKKLKMASWEGLAQGDTRDQQNNQKGFTKQKAKVK